MSGKSHTFLGSPSFTKIFALASFILFSSLFTSDQIFAEPITLLQNNGLGVCTDTSNQTSALTIAGNSGEAIISWVDSRDALQQIYLQKIDILGNTIWTNNGISSASPIAYQTNMQLIKGTPGGCIVTWSDNSSLVSTESQSISSTGSLAWTPASGVTIRRGVDTWIRLTTASDGTGGVITTVSDKTSSLTMPFTYHHDQYGSKLWGPALIVLANSDKRDFASTTNSIGNTFVVFSDNRSQASPMVLWSLSNSDIWAQVINSSGTLTAPNSGIALCTAAGEQSEPKIISDSTGAIVVWKDFRNGSNFDIYARKINNNGNELWINNGIPICTASGDQIQVDMCDDGAGGAYIVWRDARTTPGQVYIQRITGAGSIYPGWTANGKQVAPTTGWQVLPKVANDSNNNAVVAWQDYRSGTTYDIYAQKISGSGSLLWGASGTLICNASYDQTNPSITKVKPGVVNIAWTDQRAWSNNDIYCQMITDSINTVYISPTGNDHMGDGSLSAPFKTIQFGLSYVSSNGEVRLLPGVYTQEASTYVNSSMANWPNRTGIKLTLNPGSTSPATIDARSLGRIFNIPYAVNMTIEGVNIINGKVSWNTGDNGGAINISQNTNLTLNNVSIVSCTADAGGGPNGSGGGIYISGSAPNAKIISRNCIFYNNNAGSNGGAINGGSGEAVSCRFENNIAANRGGATSGVNWSLDRSLFINNRGGLGGAIANGNTMTASNCAFYGNIASVGGVIDEVNIPRFNNCSIIGNSATDGAVSYGYYDVYFTNSIMWDNHAAGGGYIYTNGSGNCYFNNCIVDQRFPPNANSGMFPSNYYGSDDPKFLSTTYGSADFLAPAPGSLCIDNALMSVTLSSTLDAAGNPRNHGFARDIGAYEFQGPSIRITTPEAGKIYTGMTDMTIGWATSDEAGIAANSINIRRSQDNGLTWISIASGLANTGIYTWESAPAGNYIISIEASNTGGMYGVASSLTPFSFSLGTVYVSPSGDDSTGLGTLDSPFKTIQKGLNAVSTGETVKVLAGTYSGTKNIALNWPQINNITLSGEGYASSIIDAASVNRILSIEVNINATIEGLAFNNGQAPAVTGTSIGQHGGAIKSMARSLQIKNCSFNGNKAGNASGTAHGGNGGAIWADNITSGILNINNSNFDNNGGGATSAMATGGIGGAINSNTVTSIDASSFTNNYSGIGYGSGAGGAINISLATGLTYITNSNFYFNKTNGGGWTGGAGGAVYSSNAPIISNCSFIGNSTGSGDGSSGGAGGAIVCGGTGVAQIYSSQFITNETGSSVSSAGGDGGAINGGKIYARYCSFVSNETGYSGMAGGFASGGAIFATTITLESCSFKTNLAGNGSSLGGFGGAVMGNASGSNIFVNKCTFEANRSGDSGSGTGCTGGNGGAISAGNIGTVVATNCVFNSNKAGGAGGAGGLGGAIFTQHLSSLNCSFSSNKAGGDGSLGGNGGATYTIVDTVATNCAFVSNEAGESSGTLGSGGAVYASIASIVNCSLSYNKTGLRSGGSVSGGGIQVTNIPSSKIINSILYNNKKCLSGAYVPDQTNITNITFSNVEGIGPSGGNLSLDPKFLSYDVNNPYFILPGNLYAFMNIATTLPSSSPDLRENVRPQRGPNYDMGAIEGGYFIPAITTPSVKVDGQYVSQVKYLPKLPLIEADIVDPMAQFIPTSTEVVIGAYHYWANSTYIGNNTAHITLTPTSEFPEGLNTFTIYARGIYGDTSTYISNQMSVDSVLSVTGKMKNIPNPFRPRHGQSTTIVYTLTTDTNVKLMIYDITGRAIWQKSYAAGTGGGKTNENRVIWDGKTDFNEFAGNGAYIYILTDGKKIIAKGQLAVID